MPTNVNVDIYRNADPSNPYGGGQPAGLGVPGYLQPRVQTGRHGTALYLKWTHILYLNPGVDIRDAYNSQLDPARNNTLADVVMLADPQSGSRTAFYVVYVEAALFGGAASHLRAYLDRFQPASWPTQAL